MTFLSAEISAQEKQSVEGFEEIAYNANRSSKYIDFRGNQTGYMTAGWWIKGQTEKNILSWKTAIVPEKVQTTFSFIGSSSVLPSEITVGPKVRLTVNGNYALTFNIGRTHNFSWKEGEFEMPDGSIVMGVIGYGLNGDGKNVRSGNQYIKRK